MGKKHGTSQPKKIMKSRHSKRLYEKKMQKITEALRQISLDNGPHDSNDAEHSLLRVRSKAQTSKSPKKSSTFDESNISFIEAIAYLKSITTCTFRFSVERLQQIFNRQWNNQDNYADPPLEGLIELPDTSKEMNVETKLRICGSKEANYIARNKRQEKFLSESSTIEINEELSLNSNFDVFETETFDSSAELQMFDFELDKTAECLTQPTSRNCTERTDGETTKNIVDIRNVSGNSFVDVPFSCETFFPKTIDQNKQHKSTLSTAKQSDEKNNLCQLDPVFGEDFFKPMIITQPTPHDASLSIFDSPRNLTITPPDNMSLVSIDLQLDELEDFDNFQSKDRLRSPMDVFLDSQLYELQDFENFQTRNRLRSPVGVFNNNRSTSEIKFNDLDEPNTPINNISVQNPTCDNMYSTEVHHYRVDETAKSIDKCMLYDNTLYHYNLQSLSEKEIAMTSIDPSSVMRESETPCIVWEEQHSGKKRKRRRSRKWSSAKWLDFNLESLNEEHIVLESVRVILMTVNDEKTAEEYALQRHWTSNLMEEAVNAVLNICDVFRSERKPDICRKPIIRTVIETLDEIMQSDKAYISQIYRVQIILKLCNSAPVSAAIIDYLIAKLKSFRSMLSQKIKIRQEKLNQLHLVFYALNIALRKYRMIVPNNGKLRTAETAIPHVTDLWKMRYIDEKLQHAKLNVNDAEERWYAVLKDFTMASTKCFVQFAKKSLSLVHVLNSQLIVE